MPRTFEEDLKRALQDPNASSYFGAAQAKSSFALTLSLARKEVGVTQKELAKKAGVSQAYIAKLEGGEANPTLEKIGGLLAVLKLSLTTGTTALYPYPENSWITIWAREDDVGAATMNYERSISIKENKLLEEIPV